MEKYNKRKKLEKKLNKKLLKSYLGLDIVYGAEVQLLHSNSKMFLNGKIVSSLSNKTAY